MKALWKWFVSWICVVEYVTKEIEDFSHKATDKNFTEPKGSPLRAWMEFKTPMTQIKVRVENWTARRRLKAAARSALLGSTIASLFWGLWWLAAGSVPEITTIQVSKTSMIILPFAVSRGWDILSLGLWSGVLGLMATCLNEMDWHDPRSPYKGYPPGRMVRESILITIIIFACVMSILLLGGLVGGIRAILSPSALTFLLSINLLGGLIIGIGLGVGIHSILGTEIVLATILTTGLAAGLFYGFILTLPFLILPFIAFTFLAVKGHHSIVASKERRIFSPLWYPR
jgi:hypothetical protein